MNIEDSNPYLETGWQLCILETPRSTLNVFWRDGNPPLMFGIDGEINHDFCTKLIAAIDSMDAGLLIADAFVAVECIAPFNGLGFLGGENRRLLRGFVEDETVLQAFPMFSCELTPDNTMPSMENFRRWTNIVQMDRSAQPWYQFRMGGGQSGLKAEKWSADKIANLDGYLTALSQYPDSWLEVRNRNGAVLSISGEQWPTAADLVIRHLMS